ncbi:GldL-related protein [Flavobacterium pedocola]
MSVEILMYQILSVIELIGLLILLYYGNFITTKYFSYAKVLFLFIGLGSLFKLMHWPYSSSLLIFGMCSLLLLYVKSFMDKQQKIRLDYLKLAWALTAVPCKLVRILHLVSFEYRTVVQLIPQVIMLFALLDFLRNEFVKRQQQ